MWQGLRNITDYRGIKDSPATVNPSLVEELNSFFACYKTASIAANANVEEPSINTGETCILSISKHDIRRALKLVNIRKADGIPGQALKSCAVQLAPVLITIFNLSLAHFVVLASTITPVPKKTSPICHNDFSPVAITSVVMKCFEKLINDICASLPTSFDPLQFAFHPNRSADDAINHVLHSTLTHLDSKGTMCTCCLLTTALHSTLYFLIDLSMSLRIWG